MSRLIANYVTFAAGEVLLLVLTVCSLAAIFPRVSGHRVSVATLGFLLSLFYWGEWEMHQHTLIFYSL